MYLNRAIVVLALVYLPSVVVAQSRSCSGDTSVRSSPSLYGGVADGVATGLVLSVTGGPLEDAHVLLYPASVASYADSVAELQSGRALQALADSSGQVRIEAVPPGRYLLVVHRIGFTEVRDTVTVGIEGVRFVVGLTPAILDLRECRNLTTRPPAT